MLIWIWNEQKEYKETNALTEKNTSKEHLRYNEKERNSVNAVFDRSRNFTDLHHPRSLQQTYPHHFLTHAKILWTHATREPTPRRYLADSS